MTATTTPATNPTNPTLTTALPDPVTSSFRVDPALFAHISCFRAEKYPLTFGYSAKARPVTIRLASAPHVVLATLPSRRVVLDYLHDVHDVTSAKADDYIRLALQTGKPFKGMLFTNAQPDEIPARA